MSWTLGRRIERQLVGGTVLVALALAAFYLAFSARHYQENRVAVGMENLALLIEGDDKVLQRFHELEMQRQKLAQQKKKDAGGENFYVKALDDKIARAAALSGADSAALRGAVNENHPPAELVKALRERKKSLDERPATVAGVVVPNGTLGTRLPAAFVSNVLIIALGPLMIFWLGAVHATRVRERAAAAAGAEPYPHALNADRIPLEGVFARTTGRRWPAFSASRERDAVLASIRMMLLAMLVMPMIAAYIAAVTTLGSGNEGAWLRTAYIVLVIAIMVLQALALLAAEAPSRRAREMEEQPAALRAEPRLAEGAPVGGTERASLLSSESGVVPHPRKQRRS